MPEKNIVDVGTVKIGTEDYRLVRTQEFKQAWQRKSADEPPWEGGLPPLLSAEDETWHLGGFKSREGIPGTSEYGTTDCRWPFRILPGPHVYDVTLTSSAGTPTGFFEVLNYIFALADRYAFRITPADDTVVLSKDFDPDKLTAGLRWEGPDEGFDIGLVGTGPRGYTDPIWKITAIAGPPDTWSKEAGIYGMFLAAGVDRLFAIDRNSRLKNVSHGLDPVTGANWADLIQCGSQYVDPTGLVAYENTVLVGRADSLYGVSTDEGIGVPLVKRMVYDTDNCRGMCAFEPQVLVPHKRGLFLVQPGVSVDSVGLERELLNATVLGKGRFRAFAVDNQWIYAALETAGEDTYILVGRRRRSGEPGLGPIIWDTLINLGAVSCRAMWISVATPQPTLWFGKGNNAAYIKLPVGGNPPGTDCTFASSSVRYSPRYNFGDWNPKDFPKAQMACKDVDATHYWSLAYKIDDTGSWITDDIDSVAMDVKSEGVKTFHFAAAAVGREIQYRYTYTGPANNAAPGSMVYFKRFARPQSLKVPIITCVLHLAMGMKHDMSREGRDAITQFNDLDTLSEQAASVACTYEPWGSDVRVWVRHVQLLEVIQQADAEPELLVEVTLQEREAA